MIDAAIPLLHRLGCLATAPSRRTHQVDLEHMDARRDDEQIGPRRAHHRDQPGRLQPLR